MNPTEQFKKNIEAIELAFSLKKNKLQPTKEQKWILREYTGFGGFAFILSAMDPSKWTKSDLKYYEDTKALHECIKRNCSSQEEYEEYLASLKCSTQTAFYTPSSVIRPIADVLKKNEVELSSLLDPSSGTCRFADVFRLSYPQLSVTGYEKDTITGLIAQGLYGENIHVDEFERIRKEAYGQYDLVTSNIPFGNLSVFDAEYYKAGGAKKATLNRIHNYFFAKGMDCVKNGGLLAFVTTRATLDTPSNKYLLEHLFSQSNIISAIRLPDNLFDRTKAGSDLIILQKDEKKQELTEEEKLLLSYQTYESDKKAFQANAYFDGEKNTHIIADNKEISHNQYGQPAWVYTCDATKIKEYLTNVLQSDFVAHFNPDLFQRQEEKVTSKLDLFKEEQVLPKRRSKNILDKKTLFSTQKQTSSKQPIQLSLFDEEVENKNEIIFKEFTKFSEAVPVEKTDIKSEGNENTNNYISKEIPLQTNEFPFLTQASLFVENNELLYSIEEVSLNSIKIKPYLFKNDKEREKKSPLLCHYTQIRDAYFKLYNTEKEQGIEQHELRAILNEYYDSFTVKYGFISEGTAKREILKTEDPSYDVISSLEYKIEEKIFKSDIFVKPMTISSGTINVTSVEEAVELSLNDKGCIDVDYICNALTQDKTVVLDELQDKILYDPIASRYELREQLLSGNVIKKAEDFSEYMVSHSTTEREKEDIRKSIDALREVTPQPLRFEELLGDLTLGERWIPTYYFSRFASDILSQQINIQYFPATDTFVCKNGDGRYMSNRMRHEYCVHGDFRSYNGLDLFKHAIENTCPVINKRDPQNPEGKILDGAKIQYAQTVINRIRNEFKQYLAGIGEEDKKDIVSLYNRKFNCFVKAPSQGEFQTFPNLSRQNINIIDLYDTQKQAIWMIKQNKGGIIDHEVGGGKTMIMCIAAAEMKRLGIAHKPLVIGLKANINEIAKTYQKAYPAARILYPGENDFKEENRMRIFNSIRNNEWDCVFLSHEQFGQIPQDPEIQQEILQEELKAVEECLWIEMKEEKPSKRQLKGLEARKVKLIANMELINSQINSRKDSEAIDFKTMGFDHIFVDESHSFKNLGFATRFQRMPGLGNGNGAQRSLNMLYAIRTIQHKNNSDLGATFLSGTTISNSLTELYNIFRYLRPEALKMQEINCFDAWASIYAQKSIDYELGITGQLTKKERFRQFLKVPELAHFYAEITDYKTAKDIGIQRPEKNEILYSIPPTKAQEEFIQNLITFAQGGPASLIGHDDLEDYQENARSLIATNAAAKMALDLRMIDPEYEDDPHNKISEAAKKISEYYYKFNEQKGTQFVFSDLGTYKKNEWSPMGELKKKLVEIYNIPTEEIRFIQEADNDKQKENMVSQMNAGEIRILFGSTQKLGTGVNAQQKCVAIHHLDIPWRPSDLEQRNGRGIRKGNIVARDFNDNKVDVYIYACERSLDAYKFHLLQSKQNFIQQIKQGNIKERIIDEGSMDEGSGMPFAEYVAILSGNTDLLDKAKLDQKITALETERSTFEKNKLNTKFTVQTNKEQIEIKNRNTEYMLLDLSAATLPSGIKQEEIPNALNIYEVDNKASDKKKGTYIQAAIKALKPNNTKTIGSIYGFTVDIKKEKEDAKIYVTSKSGLKYTYNNGTIALNPETLALNPLKAVLNIQEIIDRNKATIEKLQSSIVPLEEILNRKWDKESELTELKNKAEHLDAKIQKTINKNKKEYETEKERTGDDTTSVGENVEKFQYGRGSKGIDTTSVLGSVTTGTDIPAKISSSINISGTYNLFRILDAATDIERRGGGAVKGNPRSASTFGEELIIWAKNNNLYIPSSEWDKYGDLIDGKITRESIVYVDEKHTQVTKFKDPTALIPLKKGTLSESIAEIFIHNMLFPTTRYKVLGVTEDKELNCRLVLQQDYVKRVIPATKHQIEQYLRDIDIKQEDRYFYGNEYYSLTDLEGTNVYLSDKGVVSFIDPIIKLNCPIKQAIKHIVTPSQISQISNIFPLGENKTEIEILNEREGLQEGEVCYVRRQYRESKEFSFTGTEKIKGTADVAWIFRMLEDYAVENMFAVFIDKKDEATIIHMSSGTQAKTLVDLTTLYAMANKLAAKEVYLVHNHPSGNLTPSQNDRDLQTTVRDTLKGTKVQSIIINTYSGKYCLIDHTLVDEKKDIKQPDDLNKKRYTVYQLNKNIYEKEYDIPTIRDPQGIAGAIMSHRLGKRDKLNMLVLSRSLNINANLILPYSKLTKENVEQVRDYIFSRVKLYSGMQLVFFSNAYTSKTAFNKLSEMMNGNDVGVLDYITIKDEQYHSICDDANYPLPESSIFQLPETSMSFLPTVQQQFISMLANKYPNGVTLYHQTDNANVDSILENGIHPSVGTNEGVCAVLDDPLQRHGKGNSIIEIYVNPCEYDMLIPDAITYPGKTKEEIFENCINNNINLKGIDIVFSDHVKKDNCSLHKQTKKELLNILKKENIKYKQKKMENKKFNTLDFAELRKRISIIEIAEQYGYTLAPKEGVRVPIYKHPTGDKIGILNPTQTGSQGYFRLETATTDKGTLYNFVDSRVSMGIIPNPLYGADALNKNKVINAVLHNYLNMPITQRNKAQENLRYLQSKEQHSISDFSKYIAPLSSTIFLSSRAIEKNIYTDKLFKDRIYSANTDMLYNDKIISSNTDMHNVCFPIWDASGKMVGMEQRNRNFKNFLPGSAKAIGVWHSNIPETLIAKVVVCETPLDCLAYHQLKGVDNTLYFAFGGSICATQVETINKILQANKNKVQQVGFTFALAADNDVHGTSYDLEFIKAQINAKNNMSVDVLPTSTEGERTLLISVKDTTTNFVYLGSNKENHRQITVLGRELGLQDIRSMTMGEKIAILANEGNLKAIEICKNNEQFFKKDSFTAFEQKIKNLCLTSTDIKISRAENAKGSILICYPAADMFAQRKLSDAFIQAVPLNHTIVDKAQMKDFNDDLLIIKKIKDFNDDLKIIEKISDKTGVKLTYQQFIQNKEAYLTDCNQFEEKRIDQKKNGIKR